MPVTTRDELLNLHAAVCQHARDVMRAKNTDYAGKGGLFRNFERIGPMSIISRMDDKVCRLLGFAENGQLAVEGESVQDTALDLLNYSILLLGFLGFEPGDFKKPNAGLSRRISELASEASERLVCDARDYIDHAGDAAVYLAQPRAPKAAGVLKKLTDNQRCENCCNFNPNARPFPSCDFFGGAETTPQGICNEWGNPPVIKTHVLSISELPGQSHENQSEAAL